MIEPNKTQKSVLKTNQRHHKKLRNFSLRLNKQEDIELIQKIEGFDLSFNKLCVTLLRQHYGLGDENYLKSSKDATDELIERVTRIILQDWKNDLDFKANMQILAKNFKLEFGYEAEENAQMVAIIDSILTSLKLN